MDLFTHRAQAGIELQELERNLTHAVAANRFDADRLLAMARLYSTQNIEAAISRSVAAASTLNRPNVVDRGRTITIVKS